MPRTLVTRLAGRRVALSQGATGFGPKVWAGEFRDERGRPAWLHQGYGTHHHQIVVTAADIAGTLHGLQLVAEHHQFASRR